jgi:hypothetical protein
MIVVEENENERMIEMNKPNFESIPVGAPLSSSLVFSCVKHGGETYVDYYDVDNPPRCNCGDLLVRVRSENGVIDNVSDENLPCPNGTLGCSSLHIFDNDDPCSTY